MKILTVVGARPQFIKAAMVSKAFAERGDVHEDIIHTGQHYDPNMSDIFFEEMKMPPPAVNLHVRSSRHGEMTGLMLDRIETEILSRKPDWMLVYGDTNSTLAGALAAAKLHLPVAHVEAGLRSFNRRMPEEINRILTDHVSSQLFCPTTTAAKNLQGEGISAGVHHVGDVMHDAARFFGTLADRRSGILDRLHLESRGFFLATVHRAENTDAPDRLTSIMAALAEIAEDVPVVFPMHPRTRKRLADAEVSDRLRLIEPVSFLDMIALERDARAILTDSGGVQKEAYFHGVPCITLRDETEWVETVDAGWNQVVGADKNRIRDAVANAQTGQPITEYGDGNSAGRIGELLTRTVAH